MDAALFSDMQARIDPLFLRSDGHFEADADLAKGRQLLALIRDRVTAGQLELLLACNDGGGRGGGSGTLLGVGGQMAPRGNVFYFDSLLQQAAAPSDYGNVIEVIEVGGGASRGGGGGSGSGAHLQQQAAAGVDLFFADMLAGGAPPLRLLADFVKAKRYNYAAVAAAATAAGLGPDVTLIYLLSKFGVIQDAPFCHMFEDTLAGMSEALLRDLTGKGPEGEIHPIFEAAFRCRTATFLFLYRLMWRAGIDMAGMVYEGGNSLLHMAVLDDKVVEVDRNPIVR